MRKYAKEVDNMGDMERERETEEMGLKSDT